MDCGHLGKNYRIEMTHDGVTAWEKHKRKRYRLPFSWIINMCQKQPDLFLCKHPE